MSHDVDKHPAAAEPFGLPVPDPRPTGERIAPWQVKAAIGHMEARLGETVTLRELASLVGVSVFHFSRGFRNATGEPPLRHVARLRMRAACRLIDTTTLPIGEVARMVGYRSPQAFARAFERQCGRTPSAWRARRGDLARCCDDDLAAP